ncbi:MAG: hypothetical protein IKG93_11775 [Clostridiales bacterium]|nr:hypothetical protein [Clostridiales bacterium]
MTSYTTIQSKSMWKQILAILSILALVCTSASCKKSKIPSKKQVYNKLMSDKYHQFLQEPGVFTYEELCKSWGQPDAELTEEETQVNYRAWKYENDYIYAILNKDDLNTVYSFGLSVKNQLIYLWKNDEFAYLLHLFPDGVGNNSIYNVDGIKLDRFTPGQMDNAEFGALFDMDFNGVILQSYPAQIRVIFNTTPAGKADAAQMDLAQKAKDHLFEEWGLGPEE